MFAALGDETRLALVTRLGRGKRCSISQLTEGTKLTRQAVTKHLRVLQHARIVRAERAGRENLFQLEMKQIHDLASYLETVSKQWDAALDRLKAFVEMEEQ